MIGYDGRIRMLKELNASRYEIINYHAFFKERMNVKSEEEIQDADTWFWSQVGSREKY